MRPIVRQAWTDAIVEAMEDRLPQFVAYAKRERGEDRGLLKYVHSPVHGLWLFVAFRPIESEAFDAWLGWSTEGRCPYALPQEPGAYLDLSSPTAMCLSMSLVPRVGLAHWNFWEPEERIIGDPLAFLEAYAAHVLSDLTYTEARKFVASAVDAAFSEILCFGVPYLDRRVASACSS